MIKPEPETKVAFLPNADGKWTKHVYHETVVVAHEESRPSYVFVFRCLKTGLLRQWGIEVQLSKRWEITQGLA